MTSDPRPPLWPATRYRWMIWGAYLASWTTALLVPVPGGEGIPGGVTGRFLFAKAVHVSAYAVLAVFSGWLHVPCRYRWLLMLFLAGHAAATEFTQGFVNRDPSVRDVGLDLIGVTLGCLLTWRWWTDPE